MNKLYGNIDLLDGANDSNVYAVRSTGIFSSISNPASGGSLHGQYDISSATMLCFCNVFRTAVDPDPTIFNRIKAAMLLSNAVAERSQTPNNESVTSIICLYNNDGVTGNDYESPAFTSWLNTALPGWNISGNANYIKSGIILCTTWSGSPADLYLSTIEGTVAEPFFYIVSKNHTPDYRVFDKFHCSSVRNGSFHLTNPIYQDTAKPNMIRFDFPAPFSAATIQSYLIKRVKDVVASTRTVLCVPDSLWTRDTDDGAPSPVAKVTNGSKLVFTFSEKSVGALDVSKYTISGTPAVPAGLTLSARGLSPDTNAGIPDGLLASAYILDTQAPETKDRWELTLNGLSSADAGTILTISPSAILVGSGFPFALDAANSSPLTFEVDVDGAAAETPDWKVTLVQDPGTPSELSVDLSKYDGTPATVKAFNASSWVLRVRMLTMYPGISVPSGKLLSPDLPLSFSSPSKLKADDLPGPSAQAVYTLRLDAYVNGAGKTVPACDYMLELDTSSPSVPAPYHQSPTNDTTPTWSWSPVAGAASYLVGLDGGAFSDVGSVTTYTVPSPLGEGSHTLQVKAVYADTSQSEPGSSTIVVDTTPPSVVSVELL